MLSAGILFYRCRLDLPFFRRLISEVSWLIITELCHMFNGHRDLSIRSEIWVSLPHPESWPPKTSKFQRDFAQLCNLIVNVSGTQQEVVNWRMALQTADTPTQAYLIQCTLVHNGKKWDQSSDPPNWRPSGWALPSI